MEDGGNVQDQNNFVKEIKMSFSDKSNVADAEWKIKTFKQEKNIYNRLYNEV